MPRPEQTTRDSGGSILGVHPGALGDVVLFGQFLAALRAAQGGRVRLAAGGEKARLLQDLGAVDEALDFNGLPMDEAFSDAPPGRCTLPGRLGKCDLLVSCFAAGNASAERRLAALCGAERSLFLPIRPLAEWAGHLLDLWAERAGIPPFDPPAWTVPEAWRRQARELFAAGCRGRRVCGHVLQDRGFNVTAHIPTGDLRPPATAPALVLIHPGAGAREKCWPVERFVELARNLLTRPPGASETKRTQNSDARRWPDACCPLPVPGCLLPAFVVGPTELDWWGEACIEELAREFPVVVNPPLEALAGLCAEAAAFVGNDSGPAHLAAAVGARVVGLFGPTRAAHFRPRGPRATWLENPDLRAIGAADVLARVAGLLGKAQV